jgi:hypothetical protein
MKCVESNVNLEQVKGGQRGWICIDTRIHQMPESVKRKSESDEESKNAQEVGDSTAHQLQWIQSAGQKVRR